MSTDWLTKSARNNSTCLIVHCILPETMKTNIYLQLTDEFNAGRLRAIICSGQIAVLHKLAIMSKDGDWILLENKETCI